MCECENRSNISSSLCQTVSAHTDIVVVVAVVVVLVVMSFNIVASHSKN